ncbi:uncharacterized protein STEHIDRAFT_110968 [Stereum hirsutum FP-91666 SS1]|uniref:uncharacterized protein n=1 Tax=Stereum hirsutum (strain FP-91666) TaxID=721885 RepID=UPI000441037D|nr:uncharacterized protein STEHIDRAFT_110968 [Stereum hirsutum FP-91666 SS1]EIM86467.1 hypothetical protein STEHIDRAFT_110968 [Stereum hirsutum FP-91666 SS1]
MNNPARPVLALPGGLGTTITPMNSPTRPSAISSPPLHGLSKDPTDSRRAEFDRVCYFIKKLKDVRSSDSESPSRRDSISLARALPPADLVDSVGDSASSSPSLNRDADTASASSHSVSSSVAVVDSVANAHHDKPNSGDEIPDDLAPLIDNIRGHLGKPVPKVDACIDSEDSESESDEDSELADMSYFPPTVATTSSTTFTRINRPRRNTVATSGPASGSRPDTDEFLGSRIRQLRRWNRRMTVVLEESQRSFRPLGESVYSSSFQAVGGNGIGFGEMRRDRVQWEDRPKQKGKEPERQGLNVTGGGNAPEAGVVPRKPVTTGRKSLGSYAEERERKRLHDLAICAAHMDGDREREEREGEEFFRCVGKEILGNTVTELGPPRR